jgi:oxygen-independent coproporphyrinogen-3 oxidase
LIGPYLEHIEKELATQAALYGEAGTLEQLHLGGGTPTFLADADIARFMEVLRRHFRLAADADGEFSIEIDPRGVGSDRVRALRELGFNRLSLGVQDFDPQVQRAVNRIQSESEAWAVLETARECGYRSVNLDLIYGLPHQTLDSFTDTLRKVLAVRPDRLAVFNYAHLPGTFKAQRRIDSAHLPAPAEKLAILDRTIERLLGAGYVHIGMDHFALPGDELTLAQNDGSLHRNFQGYSTRAECDLLALGPSAIGRVGNCYAQNARELGDYYRRVDDTGLAVFRGIEPSAEDRLRGSIINELICNFSLDLGRLERRAGFDFQRRFAAEMETLEAMAEDELLELSPTRIRVLPKGRLLVRNICMAFDTYRRSPVGPATFSRVI